jgi:hypothetical protein
MNKQKEEGQVQDEMPEGAVKPEITEKAEELKPEAGTVEEKVGAILTSFIKEFDKVEKPAASSGEADKS